MPEANYASALQKPLISILVTLLAFFLGLQIIGPVLGAFIAFPFFEGDSTEYANALANATSHPEVKVPIFIMQGAGAILGLIILPLYLLRRQNRSLSQLSNNKVYLMPVLLVPAILIVFMGFNSIFIEWNQNVDLPDYYGFEKWARSTEDQLEKITKFLTNYDNTGQLILAFIVIAIIPAIGEELVFRGMVQNDFYRETKNIHVAIWVSALIFSAIHFQFYGFVPRLLLGALFGYLYYWSGNIIMPMLAHFINNGVTLIAMHLYQKGIVTIDLEEPVSAPWQTVIISAVLSFLLLYVYKTFFSKQGKIEAIE